MSTRAKVNPGWLLLLSFGLAIAGCGKKSGGDGKSGGEAATKTFEVKAVGVSIEAPGDWEVAKRGSQYLVRGGREAVFLRRNDRPAPKTPAEAVKRFADSKILEKDRLDSGGIYVLRNTKFPRADGGEPMWLKYVYVVVPLKKGSARCEVQLLKDGDKERYARICKSMKPL